MFNTILGSPWLGTQLGNLATNITQGRIATPTTSKVTPQQDPNKMKPTNPNAHTYVNGTDVKTHGYAVTHKTFLQ